MTPNEVSILAVLSGMPPAIRKRLEDVLGPEARAVADRLPRARGRKTSLVLDRVSPQGRRTPGRQV